MLWIDRNDATEGQAADRASKTRVPSRRVNPVPPFDSGTNIAAEAEFSQIIPQVSRDGSRAVPFERMRSNPILPERVSNVRDRLLFFGYLKFHGLSFHDGDPQCPDVAPHGTRRTQQLATRPHARLVRSTHPTRSDSKSCCVASNRWNCVHHSMTGMENAAPSFDA